jgi:hypothetical protein
MLFSVELVLGDFAELLKWQEIKKIFDMAFPISLDTGDVVLLYILYNLGTKKVEVEV